MTTTLIGLRDLRRRIYIKAKAEKQHRFWGLYVHVCKMETLHTAYDLVKSNNGAPGIDGVTFDQIENGGLDEFLKQIQHELTSRQYQPTRNRKVEIPKANGKMRTLGIPTIRDRVVQGAVKQILEPIFEADFQEGSFGYRPKRTAHQAVARVAQAIVKNQTRVIDLDLKGFFDNVKHHLLMEKVARRVCDVEILRLVKMMLKASGKKGVPQGGVISPLLSNVYLNEIDRMLEAAQEVNRDGPYRHLTYARYADDMVILVERLHRHDGLFAKVQRRLREELAKIQVELNEEKSKVVDLTEGGRFVFLGFEFRRARTLKGKWSARFSPPVRKRTAFLQKLKEHFRSTVNLPIQRVIEKVNLILRGWVGYFRIGHSSRCFAYVKRWVERKVRRYMARVQKRDGFGWKRWSRQFLYGALSLFDDYSVRYLELPKAQATR